MSGKGKGTKQVRACLIVSPRSGQDTFKLDEALPVLSAQGWEVAIREKHEKGEAIDLARQAAEDGFDPIVNCGGDGTLNEIVQGLAGTGVAVGTIPGGTVNVWSQEMGISARSRVAATQLAGSRRMKVDVGTVEVNGDRAGTFLMMAGLGADTLVLDRVSRSLKTRLGPLAVGVAAVEALPALRSQVVRVEMDGVTWEGEVSQIIVGNTRRYGGFTRITPGAHVDDGLLDLCLFTTSGVWATGKQLASMMLRKQPSTGSTEVYRAATIVVHSESPFPLELDGSAVKGKEGKATEYRFTVDRHALTVLVPRTYDGELFERGSKGSKGKGLKKQK